MYAEILDGLFWTGYKPPFHEKTYVLREIKLVKDWKGNSHWITIGNDIMESNSLSELKDYCKENCIELVRRIVLRFAAMLRETSILCHSK